jgi:cysteinyl-tRNA synthetase
VQDARTALQRIDECLNKLREVAAGAKADPDPRLVEQFTAALDEDLNIAGAWGVIFEWVRETNRALAENGVSPAAAAAALAAWDRLDTVLGIGVTAEVEVPAEITALLEARQAARKAKDFKRSDAIRDELKAQGWVIEDTPKGARVKKA